MSCEQTPISNNCTTFTLPDRQAGFRPARGSRDNVYVQIRNPDGTCDIPEAFDISRGVLQGDIF